MDAADVAGDSDTSKNSSSAMIMSTAPDPAVGPLPPPPPSHLALTQRHAAGFQIAMSPFLSMYIIQLYALMLQMAGLGSF